MHLPVDCNFTIATAVTADLLANRATNNVSSLAGGNGALKAITDGGFTLAELGVEIPAVNFWLEQLNLEANAACTVQIGLLNAAGSVFVPLDTHVCTGVAAGGLVRQPGNQCGILIALQSTVAGGPWRFAMRIADYGGAATVRVTGSIEGFINRAAG